MDEFGHAMAIHGFRLAQRSAVQRDEVHANHAGWDDGALLWGGRCHAPWRRADDAVLVPGLLVDRDFGAAVVVFLDRGAAIFAADAADCDDADLRGVGAGSLADIVKRR